MCFAPIDSGEVFEVEEPSGHLKQVLQTTCKDRITRLLRQISEGNGEAI